MIITRTPLRISIGGGGTDLPSYYNRFGGFVISATINKYVYITLHQTYRKNFLIKYSEMETVATAAEIKHPIIREAFLMHNMEPYVEMVSMADLPAGTGLGSSGAFSVGLLRAIYSWKRQPATPDVIAEEACHIEMDLLKQPIGKQDQYISSYGGFMCMDFDKSGKTVVTPLKMSSDTLNDLEDNMLMFFTGYSRNASDVLQDQKQRTEKEDPAMIENLHFIKETGLSIKKALEAGQTTVFAELMHQHWLHKKKRSGGISNEHINAWYDIGHANGALGGKLIGAGGGGFLLFYAQDRLKLRQAMARAGLPEVRFHFDHEGSRILVRDSMLSVGLIGAGLVGQKRAANLAGAKLVAVTDSMRERAAAIAGPANAEVMENAKKLIARKDLDIVIVSTPHDSLTPLAIAALESGKHVLVEKPAGRTPEELERLVQAASGAKHILRVGFNHRFHPGFRRAKDIMKADGIGPLMYIRARYGHGGRLGYEKEWRANPDISGGGELLDQGVHLIDLSRWLGGELNLSWGRSKTYFWPMPVEDNGFLFLESPDRQRSAFLQASCTEWKNLFDFEIFGKTGKLQIWGLGRSYGTEELRHYRMKPEMGPPDLTTTSYPGDDTSWAAEFEAFVKEITGQKTHIATATDALRAVDIVSQTYQQSCSV